MATEYMTIIKTVAMESYIFKKQEVKYYGKNIIFYGNCSSDK